MNKPKIYYQEDCNLALLEGKKIAIIGYGSQGHAHALNLKEAGCDVVVGLYEGSKSWAKAEKAGLKVDTAANATKAADVVMMLRLQRERMAGALIPSMREYYHRFGLDAEYEKAGRWHDVVEQLTAYLAVADDEGNAWGRLGRALREIGREEEARDAYRKGIEAAARHGHPSMAAEFQEAIDELNELA